MTIQTASEGISFARELETKSADFYEQLAGKFPAQAETFRSYAAANKKHVTNIERAYYGVITDAIEGCYAFKLEPEQYPLDWELGEVPELSSVLAKALQNEETIVRFYKEAAEQSKGTMADVPRAFLLVARKHEERIEELKSLAARQ